MTGIRLVALCFLVALPPAALAARFEIPLRVAFESVRQALAAQLAAASGAPSVVYREGRCRYLKLDVPDLEALDGNLRLAGPGAAALGVELFGACQQALGWQGTMQFTLAPHVDSAGRLRVRVIESRLLDAAGGSAPASGFVWELSTRYLHPRLEQFSYDLGASRAALLALLRGVTPPERSAELELALSNLHVLEPRVESAGIIVPIVMEIPDAWLLPAPPVTASAAPLTPAELEALDQALQPWDAFLVYSIKQVALDSPDSALRRRLFTLLLDSRYRLSEILSGEAPAARDPLRELFIEAWSELRAILDDAHRDGLLQASWLRYALFIDAGDALVALDRAAPGLGMHISADGLRQLARSLQPAATVDPLAFGWEVDNELQSLFDVAELPLPLPAPLPPLPSPPPTKSWLHFLVPAAYANAERSLDRWVPTRAELADYEARIGQLLAQASRTELARTSLAAPYDRIYEFMMPTTALIESCWRQYVVRDGKVTYLRSSAASVGIMQINQRVWRGLYNVERLRWDIAYNTRAGAQILLRYMRDYAIPYAEKSGNVEDVPRAAYAVYNAGPRAVGRFAKAKPHPREKRVDDKLWSLYQGIASGGRADLRSCGVIAVAAQSKLQ